MRVQNILTARRFAVIVLPMNTTNTATNDLATLTARIKAAHTARMARLASVGTMPKVGDTVVEGNFLRKGTVVSVDVKVIKVSDGESTYPVMPESFRTDVRPWRVLPAV